MTRSKRLPVTLATVLAAALLWPMLVPAPAQAGTLTNCDRFERGSWSVSVCVVLIRDGLGPSEKWLAEGRISSNSTKTHMRLSALHLRANAGTVTRAPTVDGYRSLATYTNPVWQPPRGGILMDALLGFRWVWPDGKCDPSCDTSVQRHLLSDISYTF
jgi:hypothetical protein